MLRFQEGETPAKEPTEPDTGSGDGSSGDSNEDEGM
tara:strand:+ start:16 stop:123 length:108 start_codon:yes stop_codon:yes gene_type:complete